VAGVDDHIRLLAGLLEQLALGGDPVGETAVALQRVRPPDALEAPDQHVVVGVDEHHPRREAPLPQRVGGAGQVGRERAAADVEDHRGEAGRAAGLVGELCHVEHQRLRQVVDDVEADVLQRPGHGAAAAAGHAGDDDERGVGPGRLVAVVLVALRHAGAPRRILPSARSVTGRS
jgi:hypothetical protein